MATNMADINSNKPSSKNPAMLLEKTRSLSLPLTVGSSGSSTAADVDVRVLSIKEYKQAGETLAQAFATDEVARYFIDTPDMTHVSTAKKWKLHVDILCYIAAAHTLKGLVTTCGEDYGAVALWMPPGTDMDGFWTTLRSGLWRLYFQLSAEGRTRCFTEFFPLLHNVKHEVLGAADVNSMYLVYLGTKPEARGKGYARKLIEHGLQMADNMGVPTYLESSATVNVKYYEKFGFLLKRNIVLERGGKPILLGVMVRNARDKSSEIKRIM